MLAEPAVPGNQNMSAYLLQEFQEVASLEVAEQDFNPFAAKLQFSLAGNSALSCSLRSPNTRK